MSGKQANRFLLRDVTRALRAARASGVPLARVDILPNGTLSLVLPMTDPVPAAAPNQPTIAGGLRNYTVETRRRRAAEIENARPL
jgi:hypothetical protein